MTETVKIVLVIILLVVLYWTVYYYFFLTGTYQAGNEVIQITSTIDNVKLLQRGKNTYTLNNFNGVYCDVMENVNVVGKLYIIPVYMRLEMFNQSVVLVKISS